MWWKNSQPISRWEVCTPTWIKTSHSSIASEQAFLLFPTRTPMPDFKAITQASRITITWDKITQAFKIEHIIIPFSYVNPSPIALSPQNKLRISFAGCRRLWIHLHYDCPNLQPQCSSTVSARWTVWFEEDHSGWQIQRSCWVWSFMQWNFRMVTWLGLQKRLARFWQVLREHSQILKSTRLPRNKRSLLFLAYQNCSWRCYRKQLKGFSLASRQGTHCLIAKGMGEGWKEVYMKKRESPRSGSLGVSIRGQGSWWTTGWANMQYS